MSQSGWSSTSKLPESTSPGKLLGLNLTLPSPQEKPEPIIVPGDCEIHKQYIKCSFEELGDELVTIVLTMKKLYRLLEERLEDAEIDLERLNKRLKP